MSEKYDLNFNLIPRCVGGIKEHMEKLSFPPSSTKLDRKPGSVGQALGLGVVWNLRFGGTHMFGGKSPELRTRSPEFWKGSHPLV